MSQFYKIVLLLIILSKVIYAQIWPLIDWYHIYDGPSHGIDMTNDAKMDRDKNVYLAGRSTGIDGSADLLILKYSRLGKLISELRYSSAPSSWDEANSIATDSLNNLYCIGSSSFGTSSFFAIIQKYSPNGNLVWSKNFFNESGQYSEGTKIRVDNDNNVIAGYNLKGVYITKYTSSGDSLWTKVISDDTSHFVLNNILTDAFNNIYISIAQLYYEGSDVPYSRIHTYMYDKNGNIIWHDIFDGYNSKKIVLDNKNNIIQLIDNVILKVNQEGKIEWKIDSGITVLTDLGISTDNNIIVTGYDMVNNSFDYFTKKYSTDGIEYWLQTFNSAKNLQDHAFALAIDNLNNIYVTGSTSDSVDQGNSYTVKYSDNGSLLWQQKFGAPHSNYNNAKFLFLDDSSNVYVAGDVADSTNGWNFFILKINQKMGSNVDNRNSGLPNAYSLSQNYPNPFNPTTTIKYSVPKSSFVSLTVYDLLGREIASLVNEEKPPGVYTVNFNGSNFASGIYFYRFRAGSFIQTKKFVLIK